MKSFVFLLTSFLCAGTYAAQGVGLSGDLTDIDFARIRAMSAASPLKLSGVPQDRITQVCLLPNGGNGIMLGFAKSPAEFDEAERMWTGVLSGAGLRVGQVDSDGIAYRIPYQSQDGKVIRRFLADPRQFKPKDEAALRANLAMIAEGLGQAGIRALKSYVVDIDDMLPTYAIYYFTQPNFQNQDAEARIRVLDQADLADLDLLEKAGIRILQKPDPSILVYFGPRFRFVTGLAATQADAEKELDNRTRYFQSLGGTIIGSRIYAVAPDPATGQQYRFNLYFYQ